MDIFPLSFNVYTTYLTSDSRPEFVPLSTGAALLMPESGVISLEGVEEFMAVPVEEPPWCCINTLASGLAAPPKFVKIKIRVQIITTSAFPHLNSRILKTLPPFSSKRKNKNK